MPLEEFRLENSEFIELNNLLKVMGLCDTGGMANVAISAGEVRVDGQVEFRKRAKIRANQVVEMRGRKIVVR